MTAHCTSPTFNFPSGESLQESLSLWAEFPFVMQLSVNGNICLSYRCLVTRPETWFRHWDPKSFNLNSAISVIALLTTNHFWHVVTQLGYPLAFTSFASSQKLRNKQLFMLFSTGINVPFLKPRRAHTLVWSTREFDGARNMGKLCTNQTGDGYLKYPQNLLE